MLHQWQESPLGSLLEQGCFAKMGFSSQKPKVAWTQQIYRMEAGGRNLCVHRQRLFNTEHKRYGQLTVMSETSPWQQCAPQHTSQSGVDSRVRGHANCRHSRHTESNMHFFQKKSCFAAVEIRTTKLKTKIRGTNHPSLYLTPKA